MSYQIHYHASSGNVQDDDKAFGILGTLLNFVDSNQADYTRVYERLLHQGEDGVLWLTFRVEGIPDTDPPQPVFDAIDDLIQNDINTPNATDFPLSADGAQVQSL